MKTQKLNAWKTLAAASALAVVSAATPNAAQAATILADYPFISGPASTDTEPNSTAGNFTVSSAFGAQGGISTSSKTAHANAGVTPSTEALSLSGNYYFSFTVSPDSGYLLTLDSLTFNTMFVGSDAAAAVNAYFVVRSSLDGFASNIGSTFTQAYSQQTAPPYSGAARTVTFSGSLYEDITSDVTFRIYVYDDSSSSGKYVRLNDVVLNGAVSAIPEPGTFACVAAAGLSLAMGARLRRPQSK